MSFDRVRQLLLGLFVLAVVPSGYLRAAELLPLRATYSSIDGAFAPLWLAQDKGLFTKYGLARGSQIHSLAHRNPGALLRQH